MRFGHWHDVTKRKVPLDKIKKYKWFIVAGIIAVTLLALFSNLITAALIMLGFILLGVASLSYNIWLKLSVGVELITLGFVTTTLLYGPFAGLVVGLIALALAEIITGRLTYDTFVSFIGIIIVVLIIPVLPFSNITAIGIASALLYDAIIIPGYLIMGSEVWRSLFFMITHIIFNIWIFFVIAPTLFRILSAIVSVA